MGSEGEDPHRRRAQGRKDCRLGIGKEEGGDEEAHKKIICYKSDASSSSQKDDDASPSKQKTT